jgi:diguanylate cyclase (GGDEF)-like protein/PAS domain S-box-containing protein
LSVWIPVCALFLLLFPLCAFSQGGSPSGSRRPLRTVQEFQKLTNAQAIKAIPVELEGVITYSDPEWGLLFFHDPTGSIFVDVHGTKTKYPLGTHIRLNGVTGTGDASPIIVKTIIQVLGRGVPPNPERRTLVELNAQVADSQFVVAEGVLQSCDTNWNRVCFRIFDGTTTAWVIVPELNNAAAQRLIGSTVKVKGVCGGHLDAANKRVAAQVFVNKLEDIQVEKLVAPAPVPSGSEHLLQSVQEVESLNNAEAIKAFPVELKGVVTYSDPEWGLLFVHDQTGSIYINVHGTSEVYPSGTRVLVNGITGVGDVEPIVAQPRIHVIGPGLPIQPIQKSVAELDAGVADNQVVVTEGVLRPCDKTWDRICFRIVDGKALAWVVAPHPDSPIAQRLIGATARVRGVSGVHLDAANKRVAAQVFAYGLEDITVLESASQDPFSSPPIPIGSLRISDADQRFARYVHVRGTVTWESAGRFMVQDSSGGISADTGNTAVLHAGSIVDVVGFPSHGDLTALTLSDSMVRISPTQLNADFAPLDLTAAEVVNRSLNGRRVRLKARLISQNIGAAGYVYQLEDGKQRFTATLLSNNATREIVSLSSDALLQLTGVAVIRSRTPKRSDSLQLLVESPADMVVLGQTGWFTFKHILSVLGGMSACVIATMIWITLLRRTVKKQTAINRIRLENELQLETKYQRLFERNLAAVFRWRPDGFIVDFNMAFVELLGFQSRDELIGRSFWDFHADPAQREQLRLAPPEDALRNYETTLRRDDGVIVYLLVNITPVQTPEGLVYETTAIDVTQQRHHQAELQKAKDAAVHDSLNDPLTGLPNRRLVSLRLASLLADARGKDSLIGLLYLDLDGFKAVNDTHGHAIGDAVLVQVAAYLQSRVRREDIVARLGGDEFMVILDNLHAREEAAQIAKILLDTLSSPFMVEGHEVAISVSIGISIFPESAYDAEELMKQADSAMYAAKREGKNRLTYFTPEIGCLFHERMSLENQLRGAIQRNEISVHYQPEFELATNRLLRFEALARWTHPTLGMIPPAKFIPIAEESGLIVALGAFIMELACIEAVKWQDILPYPVQVAVNVSSIQFRRRGFVEEVCLILKQTGLRPELLQIELTESVMMKGADYSTEIMNRLHVLGISLSIDDFGTGYSCLSYLQSLPFDALKIDSSFVRRLGTQPESESMIRTLIMLAHNIGMRVVVEGVETREQLELIRKFGADEVQGYIMGYPTANPMDVFIRLVCDAQFDDLFCTNSDETAVARLYGIE